MSLSRSVRPARRTLATFAWLAVALAAPVASAQETDSGPDSPAAHRRALEGLPGAQRREIAGETREIVGLGRAIEGKTQNVEGLLRDLNAEVRGKEVRIALAADVLFDFDKAELRSEAGPALEKVAGVLKAYPAATARVEGHTDGKGDSAYNQKLSERRAASVVKWLTDNGVTMKMASQGWGKTKPVAQNTRPDGSDDPDGRQKNRRVEITMTR